MFRDTRNLSISTTKKAVFLSLLFVVESWTKQQRTRGDGLDSALDEQETHAAHLRLPAYPTASVCGFAQGGTIFIS